MKTSEKNDNLINKAGYTATLVAFGWAGAAKKKLSVTDRHTDQQTVRASCRVACTRLKIKSVCVLLKETVSTIKSPSARTFVCRIRFVLLSECPSFFLDMRVLLHSYCKDVQIYVGRDDNFFLAMFEFVFYWFVPPFFDLTAYLFIHSFVRLFVNSSVRSFVRFFIFFALINK